MKRIIWSFVALLPLATVALTGCSSDSEKIPTLTIYTTDQDGNPISGVTVGVYSSTQSWLDGDAAVFTFTSDAQGTAESFDEIPSDFIVFAEKADLNNWPEPLSRNNIMTDPNRGGLEAHATVRASFLADLQTAKGKHYLLTDVIINNESAFSSVDECSKDNFFTVGLDEVMHYSEGASVCDGEPASQDFNLTLPVKDDGSLVSFQNTVAYPAHADWSGVSGVYIPKDFGKMFVQTDANSGNAVLVFTRQN